MDTQVSQMTRLTQHAHGYFLDHVGVSFEALAAPVDAALPAGRSVRGTSVYSTIEKARRQDDASLPMGTWERELKRADWDKVAAVAADALRHKSKDLQLAAWLLEAQINRTGFFAVAPCLMLMRELCERYWDGLHPEAEGGDLEFRANILRWVNDKLLPTLRQVPLTASERDNNYSWADWEQAVRNEQVREQLRGNRDATLEGATMAQVAAAMTGTPTDAYIWLFESLALALETIALLGETLDQRFHKDAPGLGKLSGLIEQIMGMVESELHKRGVRADVSYAEEEEPLSFQETSVASAPETRAQVGHSHTNDGGGMQAVRTRQEAYARLAEAADFLMRTEPHSPSPYLVRRAVEWGRMNTADLYQELFLKMGGQFNIFEMLGLQAPQEQQGEQR